MGWHDNQYITSQHILDQSDLLVESDYFVENSSRKMWEASTYKDIMCYQRL